MGEIKPFTKPPVNYTKKGNINIAYQVFGSGTVDLVYIPGWISNIDWMWACPELVHFFQELGKIARVILFDKRGTGLSDRIVESSILEKRMDDINMVMDAVNSKKAVLFGHSEGGSVSALFSATYPNKVIGLISFGIFAKRKYSKDYPWGPTKEERQKVYDLIENNWCNGQMGLEALAPSKANDETFMNWLASYFRSGASPSSAMRLTKMNTEVNIINILKYIKVPTLIMQRTHDIDVKIEEGKFIAQRIENSKFIEFDGGDHLFWTGNTKEILNEIKTFVKHTPIEQTYKKEIYTIVTANIISPFNLYHNYTLINQFNGKIITSNNKTFVLAFKAPGDAVICSLELQKVLQHLKVTLSMSIHIDEYSKEDLFNIKNSPFVKSFFNQIGLNQILVTQTVKQLLSGIPIDFNLFTSVLNPKSCSYIKLYKITAQDKNTDKAIYLDPSNYYQYDSFLENVLQIIDEHIDNVGFSIEMLSKKVGLSERQLQRKIKTLTHKSPNQLITSRRLHKAKEILMLQKHTISEIAFLFGYTSPSYFSKCFKKEFGVQPTALIHQ